LFSQVRTTKRLKVSTDQGQEIFDSGVPVYGITGWFDLFSARSVIGLFRASRNPFSRLTIGPWPHGDMQLSPGHPIRRSDYDWFAEILQFLDEHMTGNASSSLPTKLIHYWTLVEEKWKAADCWPPPSSHHVDYHFSVERALDPEPPTDDSAADVFSVTVSQPLKAPTRWTQDWRAYCQIMSSDFAVLRYDTAVLTEDLEISGHPLVTLFVESTLPDCQFLVALLDVDEQGVRCITEGLFRALHRKAAEEPARAPYADPLPAHTFLREDMSPLEPGTANEVVFDLLPVSYLVLAGHRIRIAFRALDASQFEILAGPTPAWRLLRDRTHQSRVSIPVMPRGHEEQQGGSSRLVVMNDGLAVDQNWRCPL